MRPLLISIRRFADDPDDPSAVIEVEPDESEAVLVERRYRRRPGA